MSGRGEGAWSQHLGRAVHVVPAPADLLTRIAGDGDALNRIVAPHLDADVSALSARAPRWLLPEVHGLRAGFVALVTVDHHLRSPKVLVRSEEVPEAVPTRVALDLDLHDAGYETRVTARWDVGVRLPVPTVAALAVQPLLGAAVDRLVSALVTGLAEAAREALDAAGVLHDEATNAVPGPPEPARDRTPGPPRAPGRADPDTSGPLTGEIPESLRPDADLDALLDAVIGQD